MKLYIVSVCRNANDAIRATIRSVDEFRDDDVYFLVVDGNSSDGTRETLSDAGDKIDRWVSEPDQGIYDAMNKAVSMLPADAGHVLFLGAGDTLISLPTPAERRPDAVLFGHVQLGERRYSSSVGWRLRIGNTLHHQGLFVPRSVFESQRFDTRFGTFADFDLNQRLFRAGMRFESLNRTIAFARPGGVTSGAVPWPEPIPEMLRITRKNFGAGWYLLAQVIGRARELRRRLRRPALLGLTR